jgi:hypothetical protein
MREDRARRAPSPDRIARDRRAEAEAACEKDDGAVAMGAIARAIESAVLARTGVNVRGASSEKMSRELEDHGVEASHVKEIFSLLRRCEDARFSPAGVEASTARETWSEAKKTIDTLGAP